jgi:hypothetical protein
MWHLERLHHLPLFINSAGVQQALHLGRQLMELLMKLVTKVCMDIILAVMSIQVNIIGGRLILGQQCQYLVLTFILAAWLVVVGHHMQLLLFMHMITRRLFGWVISQTWTTFLAQGLQQYTPPRVVIPSEQLLPRQ